MNAKVLQFDHEFDATDMTIEEIRREGRERNWPGFRIDGDEWNRTGKLTVRRMSRRDAYYKESWY